MRKVDDYERIRKVYHIEGLSIRNLMRGSGGHASIHRPCRGRAGARPGGWRPAAGADGWQARGGLAAGVNC